MNRTAVTSSNVASIGYDPESNLIEIEFKTGAGNGPSVYECREAGPSAQLADAYARMLEPGASVGRIFHQRLKTNPDVLIVRKEAS